MKAFIVDRNAAPGQLIRHRGIPFVRIEHTIFDDPIVRTNTPLPEPTIDERDTQEMPVIDEAWLLLCKSKEGDDFTV